MINSYTNNVWLRDNGTVSAEIFTGHWDSYQYLLTSYAGLLTSPTQILLDFSPWSEVFRQLQWTCTSHHTIPGFQTTH
jgi:hypothetical protein